MVPKVVQDVGYTAVGLGVMAVQQVRTKRRMVRSAVARQVQCAGARVESVVGLAKQFGAPVVAPITAPILGLVDGGKQKLRQTLRLS